MPQSKLAEDVSAAQKGKAYADRPCLQDQVKAAAPEYMACCSCSVWKLMLQAEHHSITTSLTLSQPSSRPGFSGITQVACVARSAAATTMTTTCTGTMA
jgi:hypothetical protein